MTETITTIIQWLIPSGSLATVIIWLTNKVIRNARTDKEVHDIYKKMYEDVMQTLIEFRNENKQLYRAVSRLERAVSKAPTCLHYDNCPIRDELREQQKSDTQCEPKPRGKNRQRTNKDNTEPDVCSGTRVESTGGDSDAEPP